MAITVAPMEVHFSAQYWATLPEPETMTFLPLKLSWAMCSSTSAEK